MMEEKPHPSQLPGWHPEHVCGMFCDGQDGSSSKCARDARAGPPDLRPKTKPELSHEDLIDELIRVASRQEPTATFVDWSQRVTALRQQLLDRLRGR